MKKDTRTFLKVVLSQRPLNTFQVIPEHGAPFILHGSFEQHEITLVNQNNAGAGVFVTINETDGRGRKAGNITKVKAVFLDLDGAPLEPVLAMGVKPHAVIESSPDRFHVYWLVDDCPLEKFKPVQKGLIKKFDGDPNVCDLPRVMRLPGFYHHKNEPFMTRVVNINKLPAYPLDELVSGLGLDLSEPAKVPVLPVDPNIPLGDGFRTETLTRLIGRFINMGFNGQSIMSGLKLWNSNNLESLPEKKLQSTLNSIRKLDDEKLIESDPVLCELNIRYSVAPIGGKTVIIDHAANQPLSFMAFEDFKKLLINRPRIGKQSVPDYWLTHPRRRQYEKVVFEPGAPANDDVFNLWQGLSCEPAEGDCSLYLAHIRDNICDGDSVAYEYLLDWMAHAVQKPEELPGVAIVLMGRQGTGKGVFVNEFGKIFGDHFKTVSSSEQLLGRFNGVLADSVLIFMDEALWGGEKKLEGALKTLITEPRRTIEFKHKDMVPMNNYNRLMMATNNDWAIPAGAEERRYCVLSVSDRHMQDTDYFQAITEQMSSGGRSAFLKFLLDRDISKTNIRTAPKTKALLSQKEESFSAVEDWWYGRLQEGVVREADDQWVQEIDKKTIYACFRELMNDPYTKDNAFFRKLRRLIPVVQVKRGCGPFGARTRVLKIPDLDTYRKHFETLLGQSIDWDEF